MSETDRINIDYEKIRLLVLDVDGVLTDGGVTYTSAGEETKTFYIRDGSALKYWKRAGLSLAWITGRASEAVTRRAAELGADLVRQNCKDKLPVLREVLQELDISADQAAVIGDDLTDLSMIRLCGFSAAPADATTEVLEQVDYVCQKPGGKGCVREVVELLLKGANKWQKIMARYLAADEENQG